jgi:hypothetical protein
VVSGIAGRRRRIVCQGSQRKALRGRQIADSMLVMDGERLRRFACDVQRASPRIQQLLPVGCRFCVPAAAALAACQRAQGRNPQLLLFGFASHLDGTAEGFAGATRKAGSRVETTQRQRFATVLRLGGSPFDQAQQPDGQTGEGQQIAPVVFQDGGKRSGISRADELEVP